MNNKTQHHIYQYIDGQLQYDPILGSREGFGCFTVSYKQHVPILTWLQKNSTGLVCVSWTEVATPNAAIGGGSGGWDWTPGDVKFEFEHPSEALMAKLSFGGA